jgi:hypothetical protein
MRPGTFRVSRSTDRDFATLLAPSCLRDWRYSAWQALGVVVCVQLIYPEPAVTCRKSKNKEVL